MHALLLHVDKLFILILTHIMQAFWGFGKEKKKKEWMSIYCQYIVTEIYDEL